MSEQANNQRDVYIWYTTQVLLDKGYQPNIVYHMMATMTGLSIRTIKDIRWNRPVPSKEEIEMANL